MTDEDRGGKTRPPGHKVSPTNRATQQIAPDPAHFSMIPSYGPFSMSVPREMQCSGRGVSRAGVTRLSLQSVTVSSRHTRRFMRSGRGRARGDTVQSHMGPYTNHTLIRNTEAIC